MICPLCQHQQDFGFECDVCGKELVGLEGLGPPPIQTRTLAGLEANQPTEPPKTAVTPMAELVTGRAAQVAPKVVLPSNTVTCRYCRLAQPVAKLCSHCGRALPVVARPPTPQNRMPEAPVKTRCRACGAPAIAGQRCGDCGREVPFPNA